MKQKNTINRSKLNNIKQWELYNKRANKVYAIFLRYCSDESNATQSLQDFFVNLFRWKYTIPNTSDKDTYYAIRRYAIGFAINDELKCTLVDFTRIQCETPIVYNNQNSTLDFNDPYVSQFFQIKKSSSRIDWIIYNLIGVEGYSDIQVASILRISNEKITEVLLRYRTELSLIIDEKPIIAS